MARLVRAPFTKVEVPKQGIPDTLGDVSVAVGIAGLIAEDVLAIACRLLLSLKCIHNGSGHEDFPLGPIGLSRAEFAIHQRLSD